jgi:hypothetical protein
MVRPLPTSSGFSDDARVHCSSFFRSCGPRWCSNAHPVSTVRETGDCSGLPMNRAFLVPLAITMLLLSWHAEASTQTTDRSVYAAALVHLDSLLPADAMVMVHPGMLHIDPDDRLFAPPDQGSFYQSHPEDAIGCVVRESPRFTVCRTASGGACTPSQSTATVTFSAIDWTLEERPRLWLGVHELHSGHYSARTFEAHFSRDEGAWRVVRWQVLWFEH